MTRRQSAHPLCALTLLLMVAAGCVDSDQPEVTAPGTRSSSVNSDLRPRFRNIDEEFAFYATQGTIPGGFGGYFFDAQMRLTMHLVDMSRKTEAVSALTSILQALGPRRPDMQISHGDIQVLQGQYDFATLLGWRRTINDVVSQLPDIQFTDVDERINRVVIGVGDQETATRVEAALAGTNVPRAAVKIEQVERYRLTKTLKDYTPEVDGGYYIGRVTNDGKRGDCSLGFTARMDGQLGFITASHCSDRYGMDSPTEEFYQTGINDPLVGERKIGEEKYDRELRTDEPFCPPDKWCKRADALFAVWTAPSRARYRIARPEHIHSDTIHPIYPYWDVVGRADYPTSGQTLYKVGMITGLQKGTVQRTCVDIPHPDNAAIVFLCQDELEAPSRVGDSGGPVFSLADDYSVNIYGVSWSGASLGTIFSAMLNIEQELWYKSVVVTP
jgi:hypothetical protein